MNKKRLGDVLIEKGLLSRDEVERAVASRSGSERLGEILAANKTVSKRDLGVALEAINGMAYIECPPAEIDPEVLAKIPARLAARSCALPVAEKDNKLVLAMGEPQNLAVLEELEFTANMAIEPRFSFRSDVVDGIRQFYGDAAGPAPGTLTPSVPVRRPGLGSVRWAVRVAVLVGLCAAAIAGWQAASVVRAAIGTFSAPAADVSSSVVPETPDASPNLAGAVAEAPRSTELLSGASDSIEVSDAPAGPGVGAAPLAPIRDEPQESVAVIVEPASGAPAGVSPDRGGSEVQVGAFREVDNARRLVDTLRTEHEQVHMLRTPSGLYLVRVGPFADQTVADRVALDIQDETGLSPVVRRSRE